MGKQKIKGSSGITAGGNVTFGDVSGQVAIGENITQTQNLSSSDRRVPIFCRASSPSNAS